MDPNYELDTHIDFLPRAEVASSRMSNLGELTKTLAMAEKFDDRSEKRVRDMQGMYSFEGADQITYALLLTPR